MPRRRRRGRRRTARHHRRPRRSAGAADGRAMNRAARARTPDWDRSPHRPRTPPASSRSAPDEPTHGRGPLGGAAIFAVLFWRLGTGPFLDGIRTVDGPALAAAAAIALLTTRLLRLALEDRRPRSRRRPAAAGRGGGVLPVAVPQRHAARRSRRRRPPRGQPRPRGQRRQPRAARRRVGALRRAGRAGGPDASPCCSCCPRRCSRPCRWSRSRWPWRVVGIVLAARALPGGGRVPARPGLERRGRRHPRRAARADGRGWASRSPRRWPWPASQPRS